MLFSTLAFLHSYIKQVGFFCHRNLKLWKPICCDQALNLLVLHNQNHKIWFASRVRSYGYAYS
jgi:hypothetical protein